MKKLLLALLCIPNIQAMELIESSNVSSKDQALKLYTNHKDMFDEDENAAYRVERSSMNKELRDILAHNALTKFKEAGYIRVNKDNTGKYALAAHVRGLGGGPVLASIFYWGTKAVCYGTALAGATTVVVATGGVAGGVTGGAVALIGSGASAGTGVVAGVITGAGFATEASLATASIVTSSGGIVGAVATVESAAGFMGAIGLAIPWL